MVTGISPDNEAFLDRIVATGQFPTREAALDEAVRAYRKLREDAAKEGSTREPTDQWIARIRAWSDRHPVVKGFVDDSRESIY